MLSVQQPTDVPANAPDHCPGTESDLAGKVDACEGCPNQDICASGQAKSTTQDPTTIPMINERLAGVKRKILVLSGKGGVGKSTFTSQLGWALAADEDVQVMFFFTFASLDVKKRLLTVGPLPFATSRSPILGSLPTRPPCTAINTPTFALAQTEYHPNSTTAAETLTRTRGPRPTSIPPSNRALGYPTWVG